MLGGEVLGDGFGLIAAGGVDDGDIGAFFGQCVTDALSETAIAACDQSEGAFEFDWVPTRPWWMAVFPAMVMPMTSVICCSERRIRRALPTAAARPVMVVWSTPSVTASRPSRILQKTSLARTLATMRSRPLLPEISAAVSKAARVSLGWPGLWVALT